MNSLWINKYRPKKLKNIIGHKNQIKKIKNWLSKFDEHKVKSLIISGNHGIGKTITLKLILEELNYKIKIIFPNEIKTLRSDNNFFDYHNYKNSVNNKMNINNKTNDKFIIIFVETETITLTSEKKYIFNIYKENNKLKSFPIIFISSNNHSKLLNDLKRYCEEIVFYSPSNYETTNLISRLCKKEKIFIKDNYVFEKLIDFSQNDIRRLINLMQEISFHYKNKELTVKRIDKFIKKSEYKNEEIGLFDSTLNLLNNYDSSDNIYKLYHSEKVLLPLMIHQNYKNKIVHKSNPYEEKLFKLVKISDSISRGDNIETSIYTDQNWYLQNIHGFFTCLNTSYWINKNNDKQLYKNEIKFSSDLNKTSLRNINKKNINNLLKIIPKKSINEISFLNKICNNLLISNREKEIFDILKSYLKDFDIKDFELFLKIDKTSHLVGLIKENKNKKKINNLLKSNI